MRLRIGEVLKPQGIKGEIKVRSFFDVPEDFSGLSSLSIDGVRYDIDGVRIREGFVYLRLRGVASIETAELLRGKILEIERESAPKLPDGRFYIEDILGLDVVDEDGARLGVLNDVNQYGSADIYSVKGEKNFMFPALNSVIIKIDLDIGKIVLDSMELCKVAVYEN